MKIGERQGRREERWDQERGGAPQIHDLLILEMSANSAGRFFDTSFNASQ